MNTYLAVLEKYAVFSGRAGRSEFWPFVLINAGIGFALSFGDINILRTTYLRVTLANIFGLAIILPTFAAIVRRLHDTGRRGWWGLPAFVVLIARIIPRSLLVRIVELSIPSFDNAAMFVVPMVFIGYPVAGLLIYYLASKSKPGPNKFGPNPKETVILATP